MTIQFLQELIEKNTRVILPEFGAFLVKDDGTGVFKPENITFSPFLRFNDGVLEEALTKGKGVSKDDANKQIAAFVEEIKTGLLNDSSFKIGNFGYLYRDSRGSVHFSNTEHKTETTDKPSPVVAKPEETKKEEKPAEKLIDIATEVPQVSAPPVEPLKPAEPVKRDEPVKPLAKKPIQKPIPPQKQKPVATVVPKPEKQPKSSDSSAGKAILIGVLVGVIFIALVITGWYFYSNGLFSSNKDLTDEIELVEPETSTETDLPVEKAEKVTESKSELEKEFAETKAPVETKAAVETKPKTAPVIKEESIKQTATTTPSTTSQTQVKIAPSTGGSFHVIVGSFRNEEFANKFSNDLIKSGYTSTVIVQTSGMHAVTLGSYQTRDEATSAMVQYRSQHPNAWILKQ
jgi:nucleoid DNA-binding protein